MIDYGENAEFITVRLCFGLESIRLILAYEPQEGDAKDDSEDFYKNLQIQIDRSVLKGDSVLIVGDLNAKLGKTVMNRDIHDMSANGKLLYDIINKYNLCVVNALRLCKGVFTRVNNKNSAEKSVLDYVIVSSNLSDNIQSMTIDEGKLFTPWRNLQRGKRFTDHNAIIFELQCERSKGNDRSLISKRKKLKRCDSFDKNYGKKLRKLNAKIDRKIARYNSDAVKKSIGKNGVMGKGDFWKLKKRLLPKAHNVPHALQDQSGFEITDPINIKSEYKVEFEHRLRKREPKEYLEGYMNSQNKVCSLRLEVSKGKLDDEFTLEEVERAISELKRGKCSDPTGLIREVFTRSGKCMILSILRTMNLIKQHQVLPFEWSNI